MGVGCKLIVPYSIFIELCIGDDEEGHRAVDKYKMWSLKDFVNGNKGVEVSVASFFFLLFIKCHNRSQKLGLEIK